MTKERLRGYRDLLREKLALERQIDTIEGTMYRPKAPRLDRTPDAAAGRGVMDDLAARHQELLDLYQVKLAEMTRELLDIERAVDALPPTERLLLRLRYLQGMSWEAVCVEMSYSWRQVHRLHAKALADLRDVG